MYPHYHWHYGAQTYALLSHQFLRLPKKGHFGALEKKYCKTLSEVQIRIAIAYSFGHL